MAKKKLEGWQKGEGPYSKSDDLEIRQGGDPVNVHTDIFNRVTKNAERNDGFSAKLTSKE